MSEFVGTVISTMTSPSPSEMNFVVTHGNVHRGQFVEAEYSEGTLVSLITNVIKTNHYFERADSVKEFEARGSALFEQFPVSEWEYLIATTKPLGVFQNERVQRSSFPPSPGTKVKLASSETLKNFYKFDEEKGIHLGKVEFHDLDVNINLTKLLKKHLAILSISGGGKCVSPHSRILLSNGKNIEIGKLVEQHLAKQRVIEDGVEISYDNPNEFEVFSLTEENKIVRSKITAFTRRKAPKEMLKIRTRSGRVLEVTPEHPIPVMAGSIDWIPAAELKEGNRLLAAKPLVNSNISFDKITRIEKFKPKYEYVYDLCIEDHNFVCEDLIVHNSYATSVLFEELLDRKKEHGRIATIVLDPHGEYSSFAMPPTDGSKDYSDRTLVIKGNSVRIGVPSLSIGMISGLIPGLSGPQKRDLARLISELGKEMKSGLGPFDFERLKKAIIEDTEIKDNTKGPLLGWLSELESMRLFAKTDTPSVRDIVRPGCLTVVDLSDIINLRKKQIIVSFFAQKLFNERRKKAIPPFLFVLEEAHQFCLSKDTEILTEKGWKKYVDLSVGDSAFSFDPASKKLELNPIERIIVRQHKGKLVKLFNEDSIDSLVTADHRVLCDTRTTGKDRKWKWSKNKFVSASALPSGARIPVAAELNSDTECKIDFDLIKILGWIITDGWLQDYKKGKRAHYKISQSASKGKILEEMKKTIKKRFSESSVYSRKRNENFINGRRLKRTEEFTFYLGASPSRDIWPWLGGEPHRIPRKFLETASLKQMKIIFDALVQGDGHVQLTKNNHKYVVFYAGHNIALADDFQELCVKLGYSAIIKKVPQNGQTKVLVSFKRKYSYVRKRAEENYSGNVWDITIKHGAFVARRNGKVFITGNCPQQAIKENSVSRSIIRTIAREGRKFGASLCLISQRPIQLDTTALSQCNSKLILRITNPYDLEHIAQSAEAIDQRSKDMITSLQVGEGLLLGEAVNYPLFFKVRKRHSNPSKHELSLEQAAINFEENQKESDKETEAFL